MAKFNLWQGVADCNERADRPEIELYEFINQIRNGDYRAAVEAVRNAATKEARNEAKKRLPAASTSGKFTTRTDGGLLCHSGYICIDFDKLDDAAATKETLTHDPFTLACFITASGCGLAVVIELAEPERHEQYFQSLEKYYFDKYGLVADSSCRNISRLRFASYDPEAVYNINATAYSHILPVPKKEPRKYKHIPHTKNDIDRIIKQVNCDITDGSYEQWTKLGLSLATLGEAGREYFHICSQYHGKYNQQQADKKFDNLLNTANGEVTIGTLYHYAKMRGIDVNSGKPKNIQRICRDARRNGEALQDAINRSRKLGFTIAAKDEDELVKEIFDGQETIEAGGIQEIEDMALDLFPTRYNTMRELYEHETTGERWSDAKSRSVYIQIKKTIPNTRHNDIEAILTNDDRPRFDPIMDFIEAHKGYRTRDGIIKALSDTIEAVAETDVNRMFREHCLTKWLIGLHAHLDNQPNPLMIVLHGRNNTGKTTFFRELLPADLRGYYCETLDVLDKESALAMSKNLIIQDDEFEGGRKLEDRKLRKILTSTNAELRQAYGRHVKNYKRRASLCGTSNNAQIIVNGTDNRRIIPIEVYRIEHEAYNSIDKTELFMHTYRLYKSGIAFAMTYEDVQTLQEISIDNTVPNSYIERIERYFRKPDNEYEGEEMTATDVMDYICEKIRMSGTQGIVGHWGRALKEMGFKCTRTTTRRTWRVCKRTIFDAYSAE